MSYDFRQAVREAFPLGFRMPGPRCPPHQGIDRDRWEWKRTHPKQFKWLRANAHRNKFAHSLIEGIQTFGKPTSRQQAALDGIIKET